MLAESLFSPIFGGGGASGEGFSNFLKSLTGMAMGGPVSAGTPYMVGESGPELFVPGASGSIVPNHKMGGAAITYNIDARGVDEASVMMRLVPVLERTVEATKNEIRKDMDEGRFR
jgi:hypothetical protein